MKQFYSILAKHFLGETTPIEEKQIEHFKQKNEIEYNTLKQLWHTDNDINIKEFNKEKALKRIEREVRGKKTKVIPFSIIQKVAAAVVILVISTVWGYFAFNSFNSTVTVVAQNTVKEVQLKDGTLIWLNKGSELTYPKTFEKNNRTVSLKGKAFFDVEKDKQRPFSITLKNTKVTVLGTSFNIKEDSLQTHVTVKTGRVNVEALHLNQSVILTPGNSVTVTNDKIEEQKTKNANYLSWKTGQFEFVNTPIVHVVKDLNTYYDSQFVLDLSVGGLECELTSKIDNKPIEEVVELLELVCQITIKKEKNKYVIRNSN